MKFVLKLLILIMFLLINSCVFRADIFKGKGDISLRRVSFNDLEGWQNDDQSKALIAFTNSCHKFSLLEDTRQIGNQIGDIKVEDFRDVCEIGEVIKNMEQRQARLFFENWFVPFEVGKKNGDNAGLFTGYYEPELHGSLIKSGAYQYPVYARPSDLGSEPYYTRKEIENGALVGRGLEMVYVDDPVDLYYMHIQGSGKIIMNDGVVLNLAYAGRNNQPYSSIGKYILDNKLIEKSNLNWKIRPWLKANPEKAKDIFNTNASYIFFKIRDEEYIRGAQGVPLTDERSLAIDNEIMPYGYPVWVDTAISAKEAAKQPYQKLMVTQDTGSAIKGTIRGDIFFGSGFEAEEKAIGMNNIGHYYILLPVNIANRFTIK